MYITKFENNFIVLDDGKMFYKEIPERLSTVKYIRLLPNLDKDLHDIILKLNTENLILYSIPKFEIPFNIRVVNMVSVILSNIDLDYLYNIEVLNIEILKCASDIELIDFINNIFTTLPNFTKFKFDILVINHGICEHKKCSQILLNLSPELKVLDNSKESVIYRDRNTKCNLVKSASFR